MQANVTGLKLVVLGAAMAASSLAGASSVQAKTHEASQSRSAHAARIVHARAGEPGEFRQGSKRVRIGGHGLKSAWTGGARFSEAMAEPGEALADSGAETYSYGRMSCVPFARANSGIELAGNAWAWWSNAAGVYERGSRPEVGSVLNFRANGRMHSGHVAVVTDVESPRTVDVDHANWSGHGAVSRNVRVVDVSPANDWSAVRVALGRGGEFGSVYPTYGFIYDRPDHGTLVANTATAPVPALANAAPRDLRPAVEQIDAGAGAGSADEPVEVADATLRQPYRSSYGRSSRRSFHADARADRRSGRQELIRHVGATASAFTEHRGGPKHVHG